ncbi:MULTISPECIES: chorismate synthase [unclassified Enterococcus]|uniref:chorismate synthase n=1 Tax=unclassified Enterococcus TaxID=2608891 RepID=UPI0013EDA8D3|nr:MULTISPECIES: chorismate synthase [unclassified Enterococcus]
MRFLTAGESHGPELTAIIEGLPAGLSLSAEEINLELAKRQIGYGRGGRMKIEKDQIRITSGVRHGYTLGSPVTLIIENRDWKNWQTVMSPQRTDKKNETLRQVTRPRPGHADLVGGMKYGHDDLRNVLERSSARETAIRVAIGAISKKILKELDVTIVGHVLGLGGVNCQLPEEMPIRKIQEAADASDLRVADREIDREMKTRIDEAKAAGDTLGGIVEVLVANVPAGLGSYVQWDRKLDGNIAQAVMSINAFKGVQFGLGFEMANLPGSKVMDEILWEKNKGYTRRSDNLGGFEGGMTNGETLIIQGVMKPIPTLYKPLQSVDIRTKEVYRASVERSDTTAVPAASVICESVVATELAKAFLDQFYSDTMDGLKEAVAAYRKRLISY